MKKSLLIWILFIVVLTAPLLHAAEAEKPSGQVTIPQEILILNSYNPGYAWSDNEQAGIVDVFQAKDKNWLPVIEYLDMKHLPDGRHLTKLKQLFRLKYQNKKFAVVIATDNPALKFAMDNQAELFRNAPIVFCGINNYSPSLLKGRSDVTGIAESLDIAGTIEVMLRLHPAAREIFVLHDYTVTGLAVRKEIEALVPRFGAKVRSRFTDPLTMEELLKKLERLPKNSLVLAITFITDKSGRTFGISETTKLFSEHSPVPIYSTYEQRLGFGIVGGKLLSGRIHGTNAGRIALRVLAGEKASVIPVVLESDSKFMFDYKVMSRFGIPLSALPEGSMVINKPVSFYAAHRVVIQTALGIIGILVIVISLLTVIIIQRRRSAIALRASEEKYYDLYDNAPDMYFSMDVKTSTVTECNSTLVNSLGYAKEDIVGRSIYEIYHPYYNEDVKRRFQQFAATDEFHDAERMVRHKDGGIIYVSMNTSSVKDKDGKITHSRSIWRDITALKHAENALRESEERLRFHMDNSPMAVVEWNTNFVVTRWTGAAEKMFGWSFEETIGKPIMELRMVYEEDIPIVQSVMQRLTDGKSKHVVSSNRNYTRKGEVIHCEWYNSVLNDSTGKMISVMSQILDITGRKRAEIRLARLNDCFLQFGASPDDNINRLVAVCGELMNATCALYNRLGKNLLCSVGQWQAPAGFKSEDKPDGHICYDVIRYGEEHPLLVRNLQESPYARTDPNILPYGLQTYLGMVVKWKQTAVGSLCVVYQTDMTPSNNDLQLMTIIASAIAVEEDRRQAEEALRAANAYNRSLIEASIDPLVTISPDGKITDVNAATERVTGYASDLLIGTDFSNYFSNPEAARVGYRQVFMEEHVRDYPLDIRHCDGHMTPVLYNATLYYNEKGEVSGIFAAARDITVRKLVEAQLRASLREKDVLLNEIHHRVKNNMQVISGLLSLQAKASKNPEVIESFHESQDRIQAMTLVHEKLYNSKDFSRIGMAGYVRSLSQELFQSHNINQGKIDLTIQTDGEVYVDIIKAIPCGLILNELISNALKHAFPGDQPGKLQIIIRETEGTGLEIVVQDNGVGLPNDVDIQKPRSVGLHLVNGLTKNQLDGQIEVKRGNGTEFRITFPL